MVSYIKQQSEAEEDVQVTDIVSPDLIIPIFGLTQYSCCKFVSAFHAIGGYSRLLWLVMVMVR